jgi:hypothetical protein
MRKHKISVDRQGQLCAGRQKLLVKVMRIVCCSVTKRVLCGVWNRALSATTQASKPKLANLSAGTDSSPPDQFAVGQFVLDKSFYRASWSVQAS